MGVEAIRRSRKLELVDPDGRLVTGVRWPGTGPTLVLLHGLLDSGEGWTWFANGTRRPCVALDLPGFGGSDGPAEPDLSVYAATVAWALRRLRLRDVVLVGHSLGGAVATAVAELVPERVGSLVLLAPAGFGRIQLAELVSIPGIRTLTEAALPHALGSSFVVKAAYRTWVSAGRRPEAELVDRLRRTAARVVPGARDATRAIVAAGKAADGFHRRPVAFAGPVVVVWGDCDRVVPIAHADAVVRALPQAALHVWKGMGHHPQHERAGELSRLVEHAVHAHARTPARRAA